LASKILLDTHVAIWVASSPTRLGPKTRKLIQSAKDVSVSSISIAELNMKSMLGGITIPKDLAKRFELADIEVSEFNSSAANEVLRFGSLAKHDPFDRLILAQASAAGAHLVTADRALLALDLDFVLDAEK
jgi:PIN domain nuclease of toxin-antitoxin system